MTVWWLFSAPTTNLLTLFPDYYVLTKVSTNCFSPPVPSHFGASRNRHGRPKKRFAFLFLPQEHISRINAPRGRLKNQNRGAINPPTSVVARQSPSLRVSQVYKVLGEGSRSIRHCCACALIRNRIASGETILNILTFDLRPPPCTIDKQEEVIAAAAAVWCSSIYLLISRLSKIV